MTGTIPLDRQVTLGEDALPGEARIINAAERALTGDIYRADDRAMNSVNREIFNQQQQLAERIRAIRPQVLPA